MIITEPFNNLSSALLEAANLSVHEVVLVIGEEPKFDGLPSRRLPQKLLKSYALAISHVSLGRSIRKSKTSDATIVYGFSTELLWLTYFSSLFSAKNVYLLIHHNIQQAYRNPVAKLLLWFYQALGYKYIVNETSAVLADIGFDKDSTHKHISLPHPVKHVYSDVLTVLPGTKESEKIKVGIIGRIRKGKRFHETLNILLKIQIRHDFTLVIGVDDTSVLSHLESDSVKLFDTSRQEDYFSVLSTCDVVVLNYEKLNYFYRCSGVVADAIGTETYVVCPNFPLIACQVSYPTKVGVLYDEEVDLETAIAEALSLISSVRSECFKSHYIERSPEKIASILDDVIGRNVD